jgi:transcriptional regulator with XRE-family HTH domain
LENTDLFFKTRLKEIRKLRGLSQLTLAEKVGVEQPTIQRWETASTEPSFEDLDRLAQSLGVPVAYFFPGTSAQFAKPTPAEALEVLQEIVSALTPELLHLIRVTASLDKPNMRSALLKSVENLANQWSSKI